MIELLGKTPDEFVLKVGEWRVPFEVRRAKRKTMAITVHPDLRLEVVAPEAIVIELVLARVSSRSPWIARQLDYFEQFQSKAPPRRYVSGETHLYLGRQYRLKVIAADKESAELKGGYFRVAAPLNTPAPKLKTILAKWYRSHAERHFAKRLEAILRRYPGLTLKVPPTIQVRRMSKRWGSHTGSGRILLNLDLILAPSCCIDYVLVHELCHRLEPSHGKRFYRLLASCLPDWESRKARLEQCSSGWRASSHLPPST